MVYNLSPLTKISSSAARSSYLSLRFRLNLLNYAMFKTMTYNNVLYSLLFKHYVMIWLLCNHYVRDLDPGRYIVRI